MKQVYLILAALMLLCLAPMPYGYFQLVRFVAMVTFGVMAYQYYLRKKTVAVVVFVVLALLFQPIYKIALGRATWNVVDVIVAALLIGLFMLEKRQERKAAVSYQKLPPNGQPRLEDNEIALRLDGKLSPKELVYVASEEDKGLMELFEQHMEMLEGWGQMIGFQIVYLPLLMRRLRDKRVLRYRAPYLSDAELEEMTGGLSTMKQSQGENEFLLQYLEHPADKEKISCGFIRTEDNHRGSDGKDKTVNRFYPLSSKSGEPIGDQLHKIGKQILLEKSQSERLLEGWSESYDDWGPTEDSSCLGACPHDDASDEELMEEVRQRIAKLRQRGIAEYLLEQLIRPDDRLSRLVITKDYRILLPDYHDMEIKMEPLVKAVYLLFLKHQEGILFKRLPDYKGELTEIYERLKPNSLTERARHSIEDVTNPLLNSINEKCARIRGAFVGQFDDYMARHYYIDGLRGQAKRISLPRNLVVWESDGL